MRHTAVAEMMATDVLTAPPDTSFAHLARLLHTAGVRAVPIVDPAGVLLGVVSEADLMASAARPDTAPGRWQARHIRRDQPEAKAGATTAAELMTRFATRPTGWSESPSASKAPSRSSTTSPTARTNTSPTPVRHRTTDWRRVRSSVGAPRIPVRCHGTVHSTTSAARIGS